MGNRRLQGISQIGDYRKYHKLKTTKRTENDRGGYGIIFYTSRALPKPGRTLEQERFSEKM
jgi:hypothetical protein